MAILAEQGIDMSAHRSKRSNAHDLKQATLVLGMAKEHVIDTVGKYPGIWKKTYTLKEFVQRATDVGPWQPEEPFGSWLDQVHGDRTPEEVFKARGIDVEDPIGRPRQFYEDMVKELEDLIAWLASFVWGVPLRTDQAERAS